MDQEFSYDMRGTVKPVASPLNVVASAAAVDIYDVTKLEHPKNLQYCRIQNIGTKACYIRINEAASAVSHNAILAADTAANAGNGGVIEIPGSWNVTKISVFNPDAAVDTKLDIVLVLNMNNQRVIN